MYRQLFSVLALTATVSAATTHEITVGAKGALKFDPAEITAAVGDTLEFRFYNPSGPHNVASGAFSSPCTPNANGFFSGNMAGDANGNAVFLVQVTSTDPIYFYCSEGRHCQNGMVGTVNAPLSAGFAAYKAAAQNAGNSEQPGGVTGGTVTTKSSDSGSSSNAASSSATKSGSTSGASQASASGSASASASASTAGTTKSSSASVAASVTSSATAAAKTTTSGAAASATTSKAATNVAGGRISEGTVLGGLAAVLGGFVALMA